MKLGNPFRLLTKFEIGLWTVSVTALLCSFFASGAADVLSLIASILGVTSLIFLARGFVIGQALMILFAAPTAVSSYPMAVAMDADGDFAAQMVAYTTVFCLPTIFVFTLVLNTLGWI